MALLAHCGHLPDVPEGEILDKSKANSLAKALVICQASWMVLQVCGRLVARLPITLLEVNTVAHVLCALCMYVMWWQKPLLAKEPILLTGNWVNSLCAFMYMSSEMSGAVEAHSRRSGTMIKTFFAALDVYSNRPEIENLSYRATACSQTPAADRLKHATTITDEPKDAAFCAMYASCRDPLRAKQIAKSEDTAFFERRPRVRAATDLEAMSTRDETTLTRWALAAAAVEAYPALRRRQLLLCHDGGCLHFKPEQLVQIHVQNWPQDDLLRNVGGLTVGMILWLSNLAYGGLHAAAWAEHFPSLAEQWLWRAAAVYISFCGGLWILLNYIAQAYRPLNDFWEKWMDGKKRVACNVFFGTLVVFCGGALGFARAFIVLEACISIRQLPMSAYLTPNWTQILPHL